MAALDQPWLFVLRAEEFSMADPAKAELLQSLGRVVQGLSALFWGVPLGFIAYVQTARTDWLDSFGPFSVAPALILSGVLFHALVQLRHFQRQERIWQQSLDRAEVFAVLNLGLVPFLFWWHRMPGVPLYAACVTLLTITGLLFLIHLNCVLRRLTAMLPDETLRSETRTFTGLNTLMLLTVLGLLCLYFALLRIPDLPCVIQGFLAVIGSEGLWLAVFMILMPLAITMALIWKIKETIFSSVFR